MCGKETQTHWSGKKYCSNACRQKAYRQGLSDNVTMLRNTVTELRNVVTDAERNDSDQGPIIHKLDSIIDSLKCAMCGKVDPEIRAYYPLSDSGRYCSSCIDEYNRERKEMMSKGGKIGLNGNNNLFMKWYLRDQNGNQINITFNSQEEAIQYLNNHPEIRR